MKSNYMTPAIVVQDILPEELMTESAVFSEYGIGYGGSDDEGLLNPAARMFMRED